MDCSTVWRLYDKLTASETKGFLFSVLSKYELKPVSSDVLWSPISIELIVTGLFIN